MLLLLLLLLTHGCDGMGPAAIVVQLVCDRVAKARLITADEFAEAVGVVAPGTLPARLLLLRQEGVCAAAVRMAAVDGVCAAV